MSHTEILQELAALKTAFASVDVVSLAARAERALSAPAPRPVFMIDIGDGYPMPYPVDASEEEQEEINEQMRGTQLTLAGVVAFEWRFTVTIEFVNRDAYNAAKALTGWNAWDERGNILEAPTSHADAREFPAIVIGSNAYCQFVVRAGE